jgi:hypothetical protein
MTILERYNAVKNTTLRDKLLTNYDAEYADKYDRQRHGAQSAKLALTYGFVWSDSPEKDIYWRILSNAMDGEMTLDEVFEKVYPAEAIKECKNNVMERAGFRLPRNVTRSKPDPRGVEYGYFAVRLDGNKYVVTKCDADSNREWSAPFTEDNFLAWARDNT